MIYLHKNVLVVGRCATAIYLILSKVKNVDVLVPANICYAAVYPVVYSGNNVKFCDCDKVSGNVTYESFVKAITNNTKFTIIAHMFGNPNTEIERISQYCKKHGIILIEDCASAMGAVIGDRQCGSFGDYTCYSTGYSKTVDLGNGGILTSNLSLSREIAIYRSLPMWDSDVEKQNALFSKKYRAFRNGAIPEQGFYTFINENHMSNYIYRLSPQLEGSLLEVAEKSILDIIERRETALRLYDELLEYNDILLDYSFEKGAVPWRKNIYIYSSYRSIVVKELLKQNIPVSDWYPVIANLFGDNAKYPNAKSIEKSILNFPLMLDKTEIRRICEILNDVVRRVSIENN